MEAHTKLAPAFARPAGRLTPEDFDLGTESRSLWLTVTGDKPLRTRLTNTLCRHIVYRLRRRNERSDPLEALARLFITMAAVGYPEASIDLLINFLLDVKARCFCGNAHRDLPELDQEQLRCDAIDRELALVRLHAAGNATPEQLENEARADEGEAFVLLERAKELRRRARASAVPTRVLSFGRAQVLS